MQPYTPHGDSNGQPKRHSRFAFVMQPYTPHGDSNTGIQENATGFDGMQPYTPHGDSNPPELLPLLLLALRCSLSPLALSRFLRRTCKVLAKTGALRQPRLRCFVRWTRSPRLPLTGTTKKRPLGLCRLRGCFWVWGQGVSYRRKRVKANTLRLRVVPSGWGCSTLCRREQAASTGTPWTSSSRVTR